MQVLPRAPLAAVHLPHRATQKPRQGHESFTTASLQLFAKLAWQTSCSAFASRAVSVRRLDNLGVLRHDCLLHMRVCSAPGRAAKRRKSSSHCAALLCTRQLEHGEREDRLPKRAG